MPQSTGDKPVSEAQRRAMGAAMGGHSNLGIPKSVGKEFIEKDPGGKLPETTGDEEEASSNILGGPKNFGMPSDCSDQPPPSAISGLTPARDQPAYSSAILSTEAIQRKNRDYWFSEWGKPKNK